MKGKLTLIFFLSLITYHFAYCFGVDVCFNSPQGGNTDNLVVNCIEASESCRTTDLTTEEKNQCREDALASSLSGLSGTNDIVGGRSLVHSDAAYLMAQLIGFTPWQAYQIHIYSESTDQGDFYPFSASGLPLLTSSELSYCRTHWGVDMPDRCLLATRLTEGLYKFSSSGGMWLHLPVPFSPDGTPPPKATYPSNYLSDNNAQYEPILVNLKAWAFGDRKDACTVGITKEMGSIKSKCPGGKKTFTAAVPFYAPDKLLQIKATTPVGLLKINDSTAGTVIVPAQDADYNEYISPQDYTFAKFGTFLHSLGDRYSHHRCLDNSYFYEDTDGNFQSVWSSACAQGNHFYWHTLEQGTDQSAISFENHTMRPAIEAMFEQLVEFAKYKNIKVNKSIDSDKLFDEIVQVLQVYDASERQSAMDELVDGYKLFPLPKHGSAKELSLDEWLKTAGAPVHSDLDRDEGNKKLSAAKKVKVKMLGKSISDRLLAN